MEKRSGIPAPTAIRDNTNTSSAKRKLSPEPQDRSVKTRLTANRNKTTTTGSSLSTNRTAAKAGIAKGKENKENTEKAATVNKKRPAWDTKGRLEDMEKMAEMLKKEVTLSNTNVEEISNKLQESEDRVRELENFRKSLESRVHVKEEENSSMSKEIMQLNHELQMKQMEYERERETVNRQHKEREREWQEKEEKYERERKRLQEEIENKMRELEQLKNALSMQSSTLIAMECENRAMKSKIEILEEKSNGLQEEKEELEKQLIEKEELVAKMENKLMEDEAVRRRLHNEIVELKGNIRVFCRIRPFLSGEEEEKMSFRLDETSVEVIQSAESVQDSSRMISKSTVFTFDKVFDPKASQSSVFSEIAQLVQSALDGYRVCIFAYGQTNSGKSYTMEGPDDLSEESMGMIPRAVLLIYSSTQALAEKGWSYSLEASYLEIYNESLRDLLASEQKKYDIKHANGRTTVTDLSLHSVSSPSQILALLSQARKNRAVGETNCNERSSRSHSVFILRLCGENPATGEKTEGILNLIDLAGSERLAISGASGDRLKETQAINKSLSALGDVIAALANKESHIPYRNSKLTYLLQNSLGGNCKTLMFVNISPHSSSLQETICSLRFATKVNACHIGTASARKTVK